MFRSNGGFYEATEREEIQAIMDFFLWQRPKHQRNSQTDQIVDALNKSFYKGNLASKKPEKELPFEDFIPAIWVLGGITKIQMLPQQPRFSLKREAVHA